MSVVSDYAENEVRKKSIFCAIFRKREKQKNTNYRHGIWIFRCADNKIDCWFDGVVRKKREKKTSWKN